MSYLNSHSAPSGISATKRITIYRDMVLIAAGFLALSPIMAMHRVTDFMIFCIFVMSFDLLYGYMGRLSFGQMLYLGTGVYVSTLFSLHFSPNPILSLIAGVVGGAIVAGILGLIVVGLDGASFALTNL
ncbi:MAG: hypothetical protein MUP26_07420, partial [Desulfobulbaceae bacterium]|nr:hypothetical protein [Desulfobulbaceae bacterium]